MPHGCPPSAPGVLPEAFPSINHQGMHWRPSMLANNIIPYLFQYSYSVSAIVCDDRTGKWLGTTDQ